MSDDGTENTTVLRREIGRRFEELRKRSGLTLAQAHKAWKKSLSTLQRLENGVDSVRLLDRDVAALLDVYDAPTEDRELLMGLTETAEQTSSWWHDFNGSTIPKWFRLYVGLEDVATTIRSYESELVPGLLQTRNYALEIIRNPVGVQGDDSDEQDVERRATVRVERQSLLTRYGAPQLTVVLNEAVLRRPVGSPAVMIEQLGHLVKASEMPNIHVHVIPFAAGLHTAALAGSFSILDFPPGRNGNPIEKPHVYMEAVTGALYLWKPHEIAAYNMTWQDLMERSLDEPESGDFIIQVAEEYSRG